MDEDECDLANNLGKDAGRFNCLIGACSLAVTERRAVSLSEDKLLRTFPLIFTAATVLVNSTEAAQGKFEHTLLTLAALLPPTANFSATLIAQLALIS